MQIEDFLKTQIIEKNNAYECEKPKTLKNAERILLKILSDRKGETLTIDEIRELSKLEKYHRGKKPYCEKGLSESFIYYTISKLNEQKAQLFGNIFFWSIKDDGINEEGLLTITTFEGGSRGIHFQKE